LLTISSSALEALRVYARPGFIARAHESLSETYPHFLPRFPEEIGLGIVANMLGRASVWGLTSQQSLILWCDWMIVIAPNFDDEPELNYALAHSPEPLDTSILKLTYMADPGAWERAERRRSSLPLFTPPSARSLSLPDQIVASIPLALHDRPEAADPIGAVLNSTVVAQRLGLQDVLDAPLIVAACISFWGSRFTELTWARELIEERWAPPSFVEALRLRLALEHGRYI
jgi:hypothetical protein